MPISIFTIHNIYSLMYYDRHKLNANDIYQLLIWDSVTSTIESK